MKISTDFSWSWRGAILLGVEWERETWHNLHSGPKDCKECHLTLFFHFSALKVRLHFKWYEKG